MDSPKARFDSLAALLGFDAAAVAAVRESLGALAPKIGDLARSFAAALKRAPQHAIFADLTGERRDELQSLAANFILRTVGCNFDEEYCAFVTELAARPGVPPQWLALALSVAEDFVVSTLPGLQRDTGKLAHWLSAWSRLVSILKAMVS